MRVTRKEFLKLVGAASAALALPDCSGDAASPVVPDASAPDTGIGKDCGVPMPDSAGVKDSGAEADSAKSDSGADSGNADSGGDSGGDSSTIADAGSDAPVADCTLNGAKAGEIDGNHGHELVIPKEDISSLADKTYPIRGSAFHGHDVTVTAAHFVALRAGQPAATDSTEDQPGGHRHLVTVICA